MSEVEKWILSGGERAVNWASCTHSVCLARAGTGRLLVQAVLLSLTLECIPDILSALLPELHVDRGSEQ